MADTKTSALAAKTAAGASDLLMIVDVSDTTMAASGTNKQITASQLFSPARFSSYSNGSPADGDVWYGSTQKALAAQVSGVQQHLAGCLFCQTAGVTVANTTTETTLVGTGVGTLTLPANFFVVGKTLRVTARGTYATLSATPGTLDLKLKLGSTIAADTLPLVLTANVANRYWELDVTLVCTATGGSGSVLGHGACVRATASSASTVTGIPNTGSESPTKTVDTTASQVVSLTATWSVADPANTVTCNQLIVIAYK